MEDGKRPHPIIAVGFVLFLIAFFGGGLLLFVNLFVPFLPEAAFAVIALGVGGMLLVLLVVGKCVQVVTALRPGTTTNLYVGTLPVSATADDLRRLFAQDGTVTNVEVVCDEAGRSRGFAFVGMADGAKAAIARLNGAEVNGRILTVSEAQPRRGDTFSEVMDRCDYNRPEGVFDDLKRLAEAGHVDAAYELAGILARPGPYHDPESAYK